VPDANPGRPTVSTPATLTPVGYLQFENGSLFAEDSTDFSKRISVIQVTKLSVLPRLELFVQTEPLVSYSDDQRSVHEGEVFTGVQSVVFGGSESGQLCPLAMSSPFTQASRQNSILARFDNPARFCLAMICADVMWIRTGYFRSRYRAPFVERNSDKHYPSRIRSGSSQSSARYGISHSHSRRATRLAISGRSPVPFGRIWWSTRDLTAD
jgi:hypothetical protein